MHLWHRRRRRDRPAAEGEMMSETKWVLQSDDLYFERWVAIGPLSTRKVEDAARFDSLEEAQLEASKSWKLVTFKPQPLVEQP